MLRKFLLASVGAIAAMGPALAADLPRPVPPPYYPPVPIFTWTGVYVGAQVGYAWGRDTADFSTLNPAAPFFTIGTSPSGVIGGAHIGYNLQLGAFVAGIEGTVDGTSVSQTATIGTLTLQNRSDIQGSIRARLGIAFDRVLIYGTGGAAFAGIENIYTLGLPVFLTENVAKTRSGWTVGGGIQYAVTNNWSIRAEYRYSDFGRYNDLPFAVLAPNLVIARHRFTQNQVQVGVSYKFDTFVPPPVVAKY
ncbi:MAG: porin family protein [Beijerinckiaceae bacterium]|nr:porin family protein [Beijerinckiaceae bacterium]MCI0734776.1 porin family protein [Beijerinckiaceae bacterium]